jgi:hypothetical protein
MIYCEYFVAIGVNIYWVMNGNAMFERVMGGGANKEKVVICFDG